MASKFLSKIFGNRNERLLKRMYKTVAQINALEAQFATLTDEQLRAKTAEFRARLAPFDRIASHSCEWGLFLHPRFPIQTLRRGRSTPQPAQGPALPTCPAIIANSRARMRPVRPGRAARFRR